MQEGKKSPLNRRESTWLSLLLASLFNKNGGRKGHTLSPFAEEEAPAFILYREWFLSRLLKGIIRFRFTVSCSPVSRKHGEILFNSASVSWVNVFRSLSLSPLLWEAPFSRVPTHQPFIIYSNLHRERASEKRWKLLSSS